VAVVKPRKVAAVPSNQEEIPSRNMHAEASVESTVESIYTRHADFAWRTLRRMGVSDSDLADAMQDVFLTVHRTLGGFRGRASVATWLFTICRSVARDRRLRAHARYEIPAGEVPDAVDLRADPEARVAHDERLEALEEIMAGMEPNLRNVFVLFEIEGMTGDEISNALGIPAGTVYSRLGSARQAFRQGCSRLRSRTKGQSIGPGGQT
jgi:RNA polymerase sigma-70 factor (ECF subfamily)